MLLLLIGARAAPDISGLVQARCSQAPSQQVQRVPEPAVRGTITDRSGVVYALSEAADAVDADPY